MPDSHRTSAPDRALAMMEPSDTLPRLIERRAAERPDAVLLRGVDGSERTCAELHERALRWAAGFRRLGVRAGDNVVTMLPHSEDSLLAWIGLSWLRAVEAPLNHAYRGPMLRYAIDLVDARVVVIAEAFLPAFVEVPDALPAIGLPTLTGDRFMDGVDPASDLEGPAPWDVACIILTSGTTGPSKGVVIPWGELYYTFIDIPVVADLSPDAGWYSFWAPYHITGKLHFYMPVHFGARYVYRATFSPSAFLDDVRAHNVRYTALVGPMAEMLLARPERPDDADNPLQAVSIVPMIARHAEFARRFGVVLGTGFGMSEVAVITATDGVTVDDWRCCGRTRVGTAGYELRVVDEHDRPVPPGQVGELIVRASEPWALNLGYYGMPEKTVEAWRNGWFHTGDAFSIDADGNLYFVDRYKDAIRRRGENISSFEVEAYVNSHPEVVESAAIAVPSELGEDEVKVCVVRTPGSSLTPEALIDFLIPSMPAFMIPRYVEFLAALPRTEATLRVKKSRLRENPLNPATWDRDSSGIVLPG